MASIDLQASLLCMARLRGADLRHANLRGTNLGKANDLTWAQIEGFQHDGTTILPAYLKADRPTSYDGLFDDDVEWDRLMQVFVKEDDRRERQF